MIPALSQETYGAGTKIPGYLTRCRHNVTKNDIRKWFQKIERYLQENNLKTNLDAAYRVFNTNEIVFFSGCVLAKKVENTNTTSVVMRKISLQF